MSVLYFKEYESKFQEMFELFYAYFVQIQVRSHFLEDKLKK